MITEERFNRVAISIIRLSTDLDIFDSGSLLIRSFFFGFQIPQYFPEIFGNKIPEIFVEKKSPLYVDWSKFQKILFWEQKSHANVHNQYTFLEYTTVGLNCDVNCKEIAKWKPPEAKKSTFCVLAKWFPSKILTFCNKFHEKSTFFP